MPACVRGSETTSLWGKIRSLFRSQTQQTPVLTLSDEQRKVLEAKIAKLREIEAEERALLQKLSNEQLIMCALAAQLRSKNPKSLIAWELTERCIPKEAE